jgi:GTP-dependent phosphoenolpyruvate carboxykinase
VSERLPRTWSAEMASSGDPAEIPIDAVIFGRRRADTVPRVAQARTSPHGVFLGATLSSETTAAATEAVGVVRRDPMAMLPFLGYAASDYVAHRLQLGAQHREGVPAIFYVNRFRASPARDFLWPGFGENSQYSSGTSRANAEEWQAELAFDRGLFRHVGPEAPRRAPYRARRPG